jgi:YggT family protein
MSLVIDFISLLFWLLNMAIFIRVILSWLNISPYSTFATIIYQITDPVLEPLRQIIPPVGPLDITPIVAMILLDILRRILLSGLIALAY